MREKTADLKSGWVANGFTQDLGYNDYAKTLFDHPSFLPDGRIQNAQLFKVTLSDFSMSNRCSFKEFVDRVASAGLQLCPLYLAAYLRLEYLDQPEGPYLTVASAKPEVGENYPNGLYLRNVDGNLWLRGYRADDHCEWPGDNEFVFLKV